MAVGTPTVRSGQLASKGTNAIATTQAVIQMMPKIYTLDSGQNPALRGLTSRAGSVVRLKSYKIEWHEDEPVPEWDTTAGAETDSDTTVAVAHGTYFKAGDIVAVPRTGEYVRVTAVSSNNLTVTRGFAGTTAAAMNSGERLLNLGLADMEGNTSPPAKQTVVAALNNFTQIVKTPVHVSRTLSQTELYGGDERSRQRRKAGIKHARLLEQQFLHGQKLEDTSTATNPIRLAGGLDEFVTSNVLDASGALSESELYEWLGTVFRHGVDGGTSGMRVMFAGQAIINTLGMWGQGKLQTVSGASQKYGFSMSELITPYGKLAIVYHPLLENEYSGTAYVLDMSGISMGALQPTVLQTNIQAPDEDAYKDQYLSEVTFIIKNEVAHGRITGATF